MTGESPIEGRRSNGRYRKFAIVGIAVLVCLPAFSRGANLLEFEVAELKGPDWSARGIRIELELTDGIQATLLVSELRIAGLEETVRDVRLYCPALELIASEIICTAASITGRFPYLERQQLSADLRYERSDGRLGWRISGISLAGGQLELDGERRGAGWQVRLAGRNIDAGMLKARLGGLTESAQGIELAGSLNWNLMVTSDEAVRPTIVGTVELASIQASNDTGTLASDALDGTVNGKLRRSNTGWNFELAVQPVTGQLYVEPVFLDLSSQPFSLSLAGSWHEASGMLAIDNFQYRQPEVGEVTGSMRVDLEPEWTVRQMDAEIRDAQLPKAYEIYLAPLLFGTPLDTLESIGSFDADVYMEESDFRAIRVMLEGVNLDDEQQRFAIYGLDGELDWQVVSDKVQKTPAPSALQWDGGFVYGVQMGSGKIEFLTQDLDFALLGAVRLPILDGGLMIHVLKIARAGEPDMRIEFDARIEPISLQALTSALGWPVFGGTSQWHTSPPQL